MNGFFIAAICIAMIILTILLITSVLRYETKDTIRQQTLKKISNKRPPSVTLLVHIASTTEIAAQALTNHQGVSTKNIEIIFVNTDPRRDVRAFIKRYRRCHPNLTAHTYSTKKNRLNALTAAYRRHGNGRYVLAISDTSHTSVNSLHLASVQLENNQKITAIKYNVVPTLKPSLSAIAQIYTHLLASLFEKVCSPFRIARHSTVIEDNVMYRKHQFVLPPSRLKLCTALYIHSATIHAESMTSIISYLNKLYRKQTSSSYHQSQIRHLNFLIYIILMIFGAYLLYYGTYLALIAHQPILLIATWSFIAGIILFALWIDEVFSYRKKLVLTFLLPLIIPFSYAFVLFKIVITGTLIKGVIFNARLGRAASETSTDTR